MFSRCVAREDALVGSSCFATIDQEEILHGRYRARFQNDRCLDSGQEQV